MPITKAAKKSMRQSEKRRKVNFLWKKQIKETKKKIERLVKDGKNKEAEKLLPTYYKVVDKAAKKNIIKKNTAARKKSRMVSFVSGGAKAQKKKEVKKK
jgi:small subunit ribosomal protein S20